MDESKVFDDDQIATFHLTTISTTTATTMTFESMLQKPLEAEPIKVHVRYINSKLVHNVDNVTFAISGKSSMEFNKQAFKLEFDTAYNQSFFSRPSIKLRSESSDPTMMREKLYIDMLNTVGVPTQQGVWVRLFVDSKPIGLYLMVDDIGKSFLKQTIHNGQILERGSLYQMNAPEVDIQGDLVYHEQPPKAVGEEGGKEENPDDSVYPAEVYKNKNLGANPIDAPMTQLIQFMKDLAGFDVASTSAIDYWNGRLDLEGFLRNMAMEYLAGSWDAYWYSGSNYFIYFNPTLTGGGGGGGGDSLMNKGRWQWISTDFDGTFGDGDPTDTLTTYQTYADFSKHDRPMITKLILNNKQINTRFEEVLREVVGWAFKPEGLFPRIEAYERMLALDMAWDYSLNAERAKYPGKTNDWKIEDFHASITGPVKNMNLGIKPWIKQRTQGIETQLGFKVQPGALDRVKRPLRKPHHHGGKSDVDVNASSVNGGAGSSSFSITVCRMVWIALTLYGAVLTIF
ncbi:hypothetical protein BG004_001824 [Podila humilis]|nr:hypothetical protein BG004_001824 [Podila humilis]